MPTLDQLTLLRRLNETWAGKYQLSFNAQEIINLPNHPLGGEVSALLEGTRASLPYFKDNEVVWLTTAGDAEELIAATEDLRAWVLPSFGWEDDNPLVTQGSAKAGLLGHLILSISPAGYFRWRTSRRDFAHVLGKLTTLRRLEAVRPVHVHVRVPSLFELRSQFDMALLTGDRDAGQEAIDTINHHQLDSAVNTRFMQILLWGQFREHERIAEDPNIAEVVQLRMPQRIRISIVQAFHAHFLTPYEAQRDVTGAVKSYADNVHDLLAGLLDLCRISDGLEARRSKAYKAWLAQDSYQAEQILAEHNDELLQHLLAPLRKEIVPPPPLDEQFTTALQQGDWRTLQEVGIQLLNANPPAVSSIPLDQLLSSLRISLNFHANSALLERLGLLVLPAHEPITEIEAIVPQTWLGFFERINRKDWDSAAQFLTLDDRPSCAALSLSDTYTLVEQLEELFTDPELNQNQFGRQLIIRSLSTIISDFASDSKFPRLELMDHYRHMFQLWAEHKKGSASAPEANLLLLLADAVLPHTSNAEVEVVGAIQNWWQARKVRAMLPFLLNALDLLSQFITDRAVCENLWIDGAEFVRLDPTALSSGERSLWRIIGTRIGLDTATIDEFLGVSLKEDEDAADLIAEADLRRIAIVSLREEPARLAAELIRQRTAAEVIVVTETHAGINTNNAKLADVVLFVWSSSTHAVYRAFDNVRDKIAYVQGTGATSIVIALERWLLKQRELGLTL